MMKRLVTLLLSALFCLSLQAQDAGDAIIGTYFSSYHGDDDKVRISKRSDGTYRAKVIWMKNIIE